MGKGQHKDEHPLEGWRGSCAEPQPWCGWVPTEKGMADGLRGEQHKPGVWKMRKPPFPSYLCHWVMQLSPPLC